MKKILYDVRQDAIQKLKAADNEDFCLLIDAALYIKALSKISRREGHLYLEYFLEDLPEQLRFPIYCIVDACPSKEIAELATNDYWTRDPKGIQAMIFYIYIRGSLYIQKGYNPDAIKEYLGTLFPLNRRQEYYKKWEETEITDIFPKYDTAGTWMQ